MCQLPKFQDTLLEYQLIIPNWNLLPLFEDTEEQEELEEPGEPEEPQLPESYKEEYN